MTLYMNHLNCVYTDSHVICSIVYVHVSYHSLSACVRCSRPCGVCVRACVCTRVHCVCVVVCVCVCSVFSLYVGAKGAFT